jgi:hypothetical protein
MAIDTLKKISSEIAKLPESEQLLLAKMIIDRLINKFGDAKNLDFRDLRGTLQDRGLQALQTLQWHIINQYTDTVGELSSTCRRLV